MSTARLDLREKPNTGCLSCDRMTQKESLDSGHCTQTASVLDSLPVRCVGGWAYHKIYRPVQDSVRRDNAGVHLDYCVTERQDFDRAVFDTLQLLQQAQRHYPDEPLHIHLARRNWKVNPPR